MKIYLASSFSLSNAVETLSNLLEAKGHIITVKWWHKDFKKAFGTISDNEWYNLPKIKMICERNFRGIDKADILILFAPTIEAKKFNGANIEVGYAIGKGKRVLSVGKIERSAMYLPIERCGNMEELLRIITIFPIEANCPECGNHGIDESGRGKYYCLHCDDYFFSGVI